nr:immunoglobulin heavy chain junction region [Macaca mulatta]MOV55934.1 immunoglobulin heavy chain junction region [Macaca mulatta]
CTSLGWNYDRFDVW